MPSRCYKTRHRNSIKTRMYTHKNLDRKNNKIENSPGRRGYTPLVRWGTPCCGSARRRCSSPEPSSPPWRPCTWQHGLGRTVPSTRRSGGPWRGWMRRRQKLMATVAPVSPFALSCSRSSSKGLSSSVSRFTSWLVHSRPGAGICPVLSLSAGAGLSR
jgi:hypothetical protein